MRKLLTAILGMCLALPIYAQSDYISSYRDKTLDFPYEDDNAKGIIVVSEHHDLVINIVNAIKAVTINPPRAIRTNGTFEYEVLLDATDVDEAKVTINRRGNAYKTNFVAVLKPGYFIGFRMEEVANPIRMDDQTTQNDAILDENKAELEFTSSIDNLQIECEPQLILEKNTSEKKGDEDLFVTSLIIPIKVLKDAEDAVTATRAAYEAQDEYLKKKDNAKDEEWEKLDELKKAEDEALAYYSKLTTVTLYCENSNKIIIDISDLGPRSKKCYVVLPLIIEKEIYKTDCSLYMSEGGKLFDTRKYKEAKVAFENALYAKDATDDIKPAIKTSIALCDSCITYERNAGKILLMIKKLQEGGNGTQAMLAEYAPAGIEMLEKLNSYKPDELYTSRIEKLEKILNDMPMCIDFTIVEWKTLYEGNALPNIEIWAYYGNENISSTNFSTDKRFRKAIDKEPHKYKQLGVTNSKGKASTEISRSNKPKGIIFRPKDNDDVKISYIGINDILKRANGTYMKRQARIKLYTK